MKIAARWVGCWALYGLGTIIWCVYRPLRRFFGWRWMWYRLYARIMHESECMQYEQNGRMWPFDHPADSGFWH